MRYSACESNVSVLLTAWPRFTPEDAALPAVDTPALYQGRAYGALGQVEQLGVPAGDPALRVDADEAKRNDGVDGLR